MQDLIWIDIKKQRIPRWIDRRSPVKSFLVTNRKQRHIVHARWFWVPSDRPFASPDIRSYPRNRCLDTRIPITHWCLPSQDAKDWNAMNTFKRYAGTNFLVIDNAGVIKHVYVNKNHDLRLKKSGGYLKIIPVGWLNVPKFED